MKRLLRLLPLFLLLILAGTALHAQQSGLPSVTVDFGKTPQGPALSSTLQAVLVLTVLTLAPTILMTATCFTRILVVLHFLRQGLGTQTAPSNQVLLSLTLVMTFFVMAPVGREINQTVLQPLNRNELSVDQAMDRTAAPLKVFMLRHTRKKDISLFLKIAKAPAPQTKADVPLEVLAPAFLISELKTAFEIGFMIFLPFLIVDMVVASILLSMGMMMLPPVVISLPFKVLLFVLVDGWYLIVGSLVRGVHRMNELIIVQIAREAVQTAIYVAGPALIVSMAVGLVISIFQVVTSLQDATVAFVPKVMAVMLVIVISFPWMMRVLVQFTTKMFTDFNFVVQNIP